jgi:N-acetylmuramoyl-L-alanine amidase
MYGFPEASRAFLLGMNRVGDQLAAVILVHNPVTVEGLKSDYAASTASNRKVRILIVPGHEPAYGGAEYRDLKERDMAVELSRYLSSFLGQNSKYEVFMTRDERGWTREFESYFNTNNQAISEFIDAHVAEVKSLKQVGEYVREKPAVYHNRVPAGVATRLYGINKWENENSIDIAIHVHFNDDPVRRGNSPGTYSGFTIYVPEKQYANSSTTRAVADTVFDRLARYNPVSNLRGESKGIIEEQDLIAIGAYNSVDAASMLIEYGYIYEPEFQNAAMRHIAMRELAYETYLGIMDFFEPKNASEVTKTYDTLVLPYQWAAPMKESDVPAADAYALQTALILDGDYPPKGETMNDCPRTGKFGPCTKAALAAFQDKYQISGEAGVAGPKTIEALNKIYSAAI